MLPFVSEKGSDLRPPERESRPVQHETTSYYKIITVNHPAIMSTAKKASAVSSKKQAVADDNLKKFYLELAHRLCSPPENPESENAWLWKLQYDEPENEQVVHDAQRTRGIRSGNHDTPGLRLFSDEKRRAAERAPSGHRGARLVVGSVRRDDASASVHRPDAGGTDPPHPRNPEAGLARRRKRLCRRVCRGRGRGRSRSRPRFPIPARNRPARKTPARSDPCRSVGRLSHAGTGRKTAQAGGSCRHALPRGKGELAGESSVSMQRPASSIELGKNGYLRGKRSEHGNRPDDRTDRPA